MTTSPSQLSPLSETDIAELDRFLASDATSDQTMMIDAVDGYLTALALGPAEIPAERWLPLIWGRGAEHRPRFVSQEQEQRIQELLMRHGRMIAAALDDHPDDLTPIFDTVSYQDKSREYLDGEMWCYGFIQGITLSRAAWQPLFDNAQAMEALLPIYILGVDEVTPEQQALSNTPAKREALTARIPSSIGALWRFWHPQHQPKRPGAPLVLQRVSAKVGRNDPCPCGSGKKYKKCCGVQ